MSLFLLLLVFVIDNPKNDNPHQQTKLSVYIEGFILNFDFNRYLFVSMFLWVFKLLDFL